jgi:hypothetical protein
VGNLYKSIASKPVYFKVIAEEISGPQENKTVTVKCPFCRKLHEHYGVLSGDIRYCPTGWGKKKYRIILPQTEIPIAWGIRKDGLVIIPSCPICQERHEHGKNAIGLMSAHCILRYFYRIEIYD